MCELRYYFKKIHNQLEAGFNRKYKKYGLTSTQLDVLLYLSKNSHEENTLTDLAAHFNVKHTSVIHVQRILEKKGLICKSAVSGTRSRPIRLTDRGNSLAGRFSQRWSGPVLCWIRSCLPVCQTPTESFWNECFSRFMRI